MIEFNKWIKVTDDNYNEIRLYFHNNTTPMMGRSSEWVDEDYNVHGLRECFPSDDAEYGWVCTIWSNGCEDYTADYGEKPEEVFIFKFE